MKKSSKIALKLQQKHSLVKAKPYQPEPEENPFQDLFEKRMTELEEPSIFQVTNEHDEEVELEEKGEQVVNTEF